MKKTKVEEWLMKSIKIGVIGLGLMGERHVRGYDKMPLVELYALCDANEEKAKTSSQKYGAKCYMELEAMLSDPEVDAVDICLPDNMHLHAIELAVKYGKHILVEKPMACKLGEANKIYEITKDYDKTFMVGHILRFDPRYASAKAYVSSGRLGRLVSLYARRNSPIAGPLHYRGVTDLSMHVMVHDIDAVQWITGSRIIAVFAKASSHVLQDYGMTDCIQALCTFANGLIGCLEACWILPIKSPGSIDDKLEIIGTKGVLYTDSCDKGIMVVDADKVDASDSRHWPDLNGGISGALYEELTAFVNCVVKAEQPVVSSLDGLNAVKVIDSIERSIREGEEVRV
jgi:predicted dehydrogenase